MPVVQRYDNRKVATDPLAGVRKQSAETFESAGGGLAQAQGQTAEAVGRLAGTVAQISTAQIADLQKKERERADQVALLDAETQLGKWENRRLYDPEHGAFQVKGKDAMPLPETVGGEFSAVASSVEANLNPRQREMFAPVKARREQNLDANLRRHVFGEMQQYEAQTLAATEENASESAVANALDPRRVGEELKRGVDAIKTSAPRLGLSGDVLEKRLNDFTTKTHVGVIGRLLTNNQTRAAKIYFEETKDEITGSALGQVEKALLVGGQRAEAQKATDAILAAGGTLAEQRTKAKAIDDPEVRDQVTQRLEHESTVKDRVDREQEEATLTNAYNIVDKSQDVSSIPAATWANLPGAARSALRGYAASLAKGVAVQTDQPTFYDLRIKAAEHPEEFATENLLTYRNVLSKADFDHLTTVKAAIISGDKKRNDALQAGFRTHDQIISDSLWQYTKTAPKDYTPAQKEAKAQLGRLLDERVAAQESLTGKKPSAVDIQATLDKIMTASVTEKGSWAALNPFSAAKLHDTTTRLVDIPEVARQRLRASLLQHGQPVTDDLIIQAYLRMQK